MPKNIHENSKYTIKQHQLGWTNLDGHIFKKLVLGDIFHSSLVILRKHTFYTF